MILDCLRAALFSGAFRGVAVRLLPFQPEEDLLPSVDTGAKLRLLFFRCAAVVAVCGLADVPYSFATSFLPAVSGMGKGGQISVLLAVAVLGLATLPRWDSVLALVEPPTKASLFNREVAQWLLAFLVWYPWQLVLTLLTAAVHDSVQDHSGIVVFLALLAFGIGVTAVVAFLNCLVHSRRNEVVESIGRHLEKLKPPLWEPYFRRENGAERISSATIDPSFDREVPT
jgi:hypothetical protein